MKRFLLICTCLCVSYLIKGQTGVADSLFRAEDYVQASIYYEKAYFFSNDLFEQNLSLFKKSQCQKLLSNFSNGYEILSRISLLRDSLSEVVSYEKIVLAFLEEDAPKVENDLLKHELRFKSLNYKNLHIIRFLNLIALNKIQEAKAYALENENTIGLSIEALDIVVPQSLKLRSEKKARNLSMFLPGVGQMYAGYWFKGIVSGGIQAGLIAFSAWSLYQGYFFTGTLSGAALFQNFYVGGIRYSGQLAERKNLEIKNGINERFFEQKKIPSENSGF